MAVTVVNVILPQAALAVSVTLKPPSMVTTSPATGAETPEVPPEVAAQVEVELQLPEATENLFAPETSSVLKRENKITKKIKLNGFCYQCIFFTYNHLWKCFTNTDPP